MGVFHILAGHSVLTEEDGEARTLKAGDSFVIRPGFKGAGSDRNHAQGICDPALKPVTLLRQVKGPVAMTGPFSYAPYGTQIFFT